MSSETILPAQGSLFDRSEDPSVMQFVRDIPKVDLHRHLTGSVDARAAIKVAVDHGLPLPSYRLAELHDLLQGKRRVGNLKEYFEHWGVIRKLFSSYEATIDLVQEVANSAASDNVIYLELRVGTQKFLGTNSFSFQQFVSALVAASSLVLERTGLVLRYILGVPRHVFVRIEAEQRHRMLTKILSIVQEVGGGSFVGVDLNGDESSTSAEPFRSFFDVAHDMNLKVTVHAGEVGSPQNVRYAVEILGAHRVGHGIASYKDTAVMDLLADRGIPLEICPTSNEYLGVIEGVDKLPLELFRERGVPYVVCTDNPARCQTSLSEEYYRLSRTFHLSAKDIRDLVNDSVERSFASEETKIALRRRIAESRLIR